MHLVDVRQVVDGEKIGDLHPGVRFFEGLASGPLSERFKILHEPARHSPQSLARFDGAPAQQYLVVPLRYATDDNFRILIMNDAAGAADVARQAVTLGNLQLDGRAAVAAVPHGYFQGNRMDTHIMAY